MSAEYQPHLDPILTRLSDSHIGQVGGDPGLLHLGLQELQDLGLVRALRHRLEGILPSRICQETTDGCRNSIPASVPVHLFGHEVEQEFAVQAPQELKNLGGFNIPAGGIDECEGEAVPAGSAYAVEVVFELA